MDSGYDGLIDEDFLAFLRDTIREGVRARTPVPPGRWRTHPHNSVKEHIREAYEKMWKDVRAGRVLLCSAELQGELDGVLATPSGRVPKQNPDRTISEEGRFIHDQRSVNELGSKYNHPPPPSLGIGSWGV